MTYIRVCVRAALVATAVLAIGCGGDEDEVCGGDETCAFEVGDAELTAFKVDGTGDWQVRLDAPQGDTIGTVWASVPGRSLVEAQLGGADIDYARGSFTFWDWIEDRCDESRITGVTADDDGAVTVRGRFAACDGLTYDLRLSPTSDGRIDYRVRLLDADGAPAAAYNRTNLIYASDADEGFYGFGAQYSYVNMKGKRLPIWCQEQGHGRGAQPISEVLGSLSRGSEGDWHTSYTGVPYYLTSHNRGMFLDNLEYLYFDMTADDAVQLEVWANEIRGGILYGAEPLNIVETYTEYTGRMQPLPDWVHNGAIVRSFNGGRQALLDQVAELREHGAPIAGIWLEDWAGTRDTGFGTRMLWNWVPDEDQYPDYAGLLAELRDAGVPILVYFNPFLTDASDVGVNVNLYDEAVELGYLVRNRNGEPYKIEMGGFTAYLVDLSNPDAREWLKGQIKAQIANGVAGWMADFGEALPPDAVLHSGVDALAYHNQYALEWAKLNREAVEEAGVADDILFFNRGGTAQSPGQTKLFWLGDQLTTWDEYDGIKTVIPALMSAGLSGYALEHPDTGGWLSVDIGDVVFHRDRELLSRWMEISAFTAVFRLHTTNKPDLNQQYNTDAETFEHFARMSKLYRALGDYRKALMQEAADKGYPVARHLLLHYPDDPMAYAQTQEFLLGPDFLVAPVVDQGATTVDVYFPAGEWVHVWSDTVYGSLNAGTTVTVDAPLGEPAVFYRMGAPAGEQLVQTLIEDGLRQ